MIVTEKTSGCIKKTIGRAKILKIEEKMISEPTSPPFKYLEIKYLSMWLVDA